MSQERAVALSVGSFVVFAAFILILFAVVDVGLMFSIGPLLAVAIACAGIYRATRDD
jgi:hypothetical protein